VAAYNSILVRHGLDLSLFSEVREREIKSHIERLEVVRKGLVPTVDAEVWAEAFAQIRNCDLRIGGRSERARPLQRAVLLRLWANYRK
jgi:hypothetical protein